MREQRERFTVFSANTFIQMLPFADAATRELPLARLLRLSLFQVSCGMAMVLLTGTLNRVMIVELGVSAGFVALMVSLPLLLAPIRALIGFRSDTHKSFLGWRRVPYIAMGAMLTFGGLAIMPFALIHLTPDSPAPPWVGPLSAGLAFLLAGGGVHMSQTAGLALAADLSTDENRPRVIALLYVMLLVGMMFSALVLGRLLVDVTPKTLVQIIQGCAVMALVLNHIALWKQEPRNMALTAPDRERPTFWQAWQAYRQNRRPYRLLAAVGLGSAAFGMQDILLEPYGGEVLGMTVAETTGLTAFMAAGSLVGFALAARWLSQGYQACRLAAFGALVGVGAFAGVLLSGPFNSPLMFELAAGGVGLGSGFFAVGTLMAAMSTAGDGDDPQAGLALGAWGAVQACGIGIAMAVGGGVRDVVQALARAGAFGSGYDGTSIGYVAVYNIEILLLFATLVVIGPLAAHLRVDERKPIQRFGITESPS